MSLNLVEVSISIAGSDVVFSQMTLHQKMNSHHTCEVLVDYDAFGDETWMADPVKVIKFIGESISITMTHKATGETNVFIGLVSNVSFTGYHGLNNHILVRGVSETIKLDGKPHMDSFVDKTLADIVNEAVGTSGSGAAMEVKPEFSNPIDFQMQYNETCFDFLNRLSYIYGESFYSKDGSIVIFGKLETDDTADIMYDVEMTEFNLSANLQAPIFNHYNYNSSENYERENLTRSDVPTPAGYLQPVLSKSESIYTSEVSSPLKALVHDSPSLQKMIDIERTRDVANMLTLSGKTQTCKVGLGKVVTVDYPSSLKISTSAGAFIVTEVTHRVNKDGNYENEFSGTRAALGYVPVHHVNLPIAAPQRATVVSNADPDGSGRVQVQMQFQKYLGKETNWLRVVTPDGGAGARGYIFVPEVGDEVMLQFEDNDPARPYCAGSVFAEPSARGGLSGNHLKSIITRSGIKMIFNDDEGSLHIEDPSGNTWDMDGKGNIMVNAPNDITMTAGKVMTLNSENMFVNVDENIEFNIGADSTTTIGNNRKEDVSGDTTLSTTKLKSMVYDKADIEISNKLTLLTGETDFIADNGDMVIKSEGKALLQGAEDARISKG